MASLLTHFRKVQMLMFDRITRSHDNVDEAWMLAQTSRDIPKNPVVVVVDSDLAYGNARALALDLAKELQHDQLVFIASDDNGLDWALRNNLNAHKFSTQKNNNSSNLWNMLLKAKVSVYDSHDWWRTHNQLLLRSLLAGSHKIQLWHGATGPVGKVFGLERLETAPTWWHFVAVSTSSGMYDALVNEPSQAEYRRNRSLLAKTTIHDIEYRLVEALKEWPMRRSSNRILIAPTYSESVDGENVLIDWVCKIARFARTRSWEVDVAVHPGAKPRVARKIKACLGVTSVTHGVSTSTMMQYNAVVTDFSGIAHDSLLCNVPTVSILIDLENYQSLCPVVTDEDQMKVTYVVQRIEELEEKLDAAMYADDLGKARKNYISEVLDELGAKPGENTYQAVMNALRS